MDWESTWVPLFAGSRHVVVSKAPLFDCSFGLLGKDLRFGYPDGFKIFLPGEVRDVKSKTAEKLTDNCWSSSLEAILNHGGMRLREIQGAVEINTFFFVILRLFVNFWFSNFTKQVRGQYFLRTIGCCWFRQEEKFKPKGAHAWDSSFGAVLPPNCFLIRLVMLPFI